MQMPRNTRAFPAAALAAAGLFPRPSASGEDNAAEVAFRAAREYTVRVRTVVVTPFLGDDQGSYQGAGFLVDAKRGWIVTNAHVASRSPSTVEVAFYGAAYEPARKVYVDPFADIAILSLDRPIPGRPAAPIEPVMTPVVGEAVGVYGHPMGLPYTGTRGIVSGSTDDYGAELIQIDATVDHGNSGGPVIALRTNRVVGIATAMTEGDRHDRMNFATPIGDVQRILSLLRLHEDPSPPITAFATCKDEDSQSTLRVAATFDSLAWPLQPGDRIFGIGSDPDSLKRMCELIPRLRGRKGSVFLRVDRNGQRKVVECRPRLRPSILERHGISIDGALIGPLAWDDEINSPHPVRLVIQSIEPASTAEALMLSTFDHIHTVDGREFVDVDSLASYVQSRAGHPLVIVVRRWSGNGNKIYEYHRRELPNKDVALVPAKEAPEPVAGP